MGRDYRDDCPLRNDCLCDELVHTYGNYYQEPRPYFQCVGTDW